MPVEVSDDWLTELKGQIGESPAERRHRYAAALNASDAAAMAGDKKLGDYFDEIVTLGANPKRAANLIINTLAQIGNAKRLAIYELDIPPGRVRDVAELIDESKLAASNALPLFEKMADGGTAVADSTTDLAANLGLIQVSDAGAIDTAIDAVIAQNPKPLQGIPRR